MITNHTNQTNSGESGDKSSGFNFFKVIGTTLYVTCIIINVGIVSVICRVYRKRKVRDMAILIGNLCTVVVYSAVLSILSIFEFDKRLRLEYLCNAIYIQRAMALNLLPLTILSISYERMRKLKPSFPKVKIAKMLLAIWSVAVFAALPALWTMEYDSEKAVCVKVATLHRMVFQVVRSIIFHFVVGGVLIFELYIVRSKFKYLYKVKVVHTDKIRRKVQRVRFLYCNSIIFVSYWIPLGIFNICYELTRKPSTRLLKEYPTAMYIVSILFFVYVMCLPLILLWASDLLRGRKKSGHAGIEMRMSNSDFSRHSTQGIVTCHIPNITITTERNEIIQRDTQAVMMQQVQVEVYV